MTDPRPDLKEVLQLAEDGDLPEAAAEWAESALETAVSIMATVEEMLDNGREAPTARQAMALENIANAARRWIKHTR